MELQAGTRLGPYEIVAPLGAGGMGEVYQARDTRLRRTVAVKVLPAHVRDDPQRKRQFEREARAIAAMNHPHICVVHDVGQDQGIDFLVLEYLEGETLARRLERGAIPMNEALPWAIAIADALDRAHREGIVHRDLKPANIFLTHSGPKLLDFGLATPRSSPEAGALMTTTTASIGNGRIVGTLPYMAPEQLRGEKADARADIFALGAVIYEMVSGKRPFSGGSEADLIAAILESMPPPVGSQGGGPSALDDVIQRCLAKDPDQRWQTGRDLKLALQWIAGGHASAVDHRVADKLRRRHARLAVAALLAIAALMPFAWLWWQAADALLPETRHLQVTSLGDVLEAALAPDGRALAYVTEEEDHQRLLVRDLDGGAALELLRGPDIKGLRWSPDGSRVAFFGLRGVSREEKRPGVYAVSRFGGAARPVASGASYAWSPDGSRIAFAFPDNQAVRIMPVTGGDIHLIGLPGLRVLQDIDWSPRSDRLAILELAESGSSVIWSATPDGKEIRRVYTDPLALTSPRWSPDGDGIYCLRRRDESLDLLSVEVPSVGPVTAHILLSGLPSDPARPGRLSLSADGRQLVYTRALSYSNLWLVDLNRSGKPMRPLTRGTSFFKEPRVSPDGKWIAASLGSGSRVHIVKMPITGGEPIPLTSGDHRDLNPVWSSNGRIAFASDRTGKPRIWIMDADGRQQQEIDTPDVAANMALTWTPEGRLAWQHEVGQGRYKNYRIRNLSTRHDEFLVDEQSPTWVFNPRFSPRGDHVAVYWNYEGAQQDGLWVLSWPGRRQRFLLAGAGPLGWSEDGQWIYATVAGVLGRTRELLRVSLRTGEPQLVATSPSGSIDGGDVTPGGGSLVVSMPERKADAWLIENFDRRRPPKKP